MAKADFPSYKQSNLGEVSLPCESNQTKAHWSYILAAAFCLASEFAGADTACPVVDWTDSKFKKPPSKDQLQFELFEKDSYFSGRDNKWVEVKHRYTATLTKVGHLGKGFVFDFYCQKDGQVGRFYGEAGLVFYPDSIKKTEPKYIKVEEGMEVKICWSKVDGESVLVATGGELLKVSSSGWIDISYAKCRERSKKVPKDLNWKRYKFDFKKNAWKSRRS